MPTYEGQIRECIWIIQGEKTHFCFNCLSESCQSDIWVRISQLSTSIFHLIGHDKT